MMKTLPTANPIYDGLPGVAPVDPFAEEWNPEDAPPIEQVWSNYIHQSDTAARNLSVNASTVCARRCPGCPFGPRPVVSGQDIERERNRWKREPTEAFLCHRHLARGHSVICRGFLLEQPNDAAHLVIAQLKAGNISEAPIPKFDPDLDWPERAAAAGNPGTIVA